MLRHAIWIGLICKMVDKIVVEKNPAIQEENLKTNKNLSTS